MTSRRVRQERVPCLPRRRLARDGSIPRIDLQPHAVSIAEIRDRPALLARRIVASQAVIKVCSHHLLALHYGRLAQQCQQRT